MRNEIVLVAEDYVINQQVAQLYLEELGFASHVVSDGAKCTDAVATNAYALVLMDCQMPEMDGYAATAAIRAAEAPLGRHTPIVAMTAHAMGGDRERCLAAGMDDYISKPVSPEELKRVLGRWLPEPGAMGASVAGRQPLDLDRARSKYGPKQADELSWMFISRATLDLQDLEKSSLARDADAVLAVAHGLAGVCATVFAHQMCATCREIMTAAGHPDWDRVQAFVQQLDNDLNSVQEHLRRRLP
jgi:CheY-like chemotaxis protein/HPt (histidine-containing phosphotransfer) domain-containing protein